MKMKSKSTLGVNFPHAREHNGIHTFLHTHIPFSREPHHLHHHNHGKQEFPFPCVPSKKLMWDLIGASTGRRKRGTKL
ncbi:hypothetical protein BDD12DRAFT_842754, partial [Trichophaea hybrida]